MPLSSAAAPARASSRKRNHPAKYQDEPVKDKRPRKRPLSVKKKLQKATKTARRKKEPAVEEPADDDDVCAEEPDEEELALAEQEEDAAAGELQEAVIQEPAKRRTRATNVAAGEFVGKPFPADEARGTWPKRYQTAEPVKPSRRLTKVEEEEVKARCHYRSANIEGTIYSLDDDVYVKAGEKEADYIGRITELFEGIDTYKYFTCRWYYRPQDTVISGVKFPKDHKHDPKRVFLSTDMNDNVLDCIISRVKIVRVDPGMDPDAKAQLLLDNQLYYDMSYTKAFSEFATIPSDISKNSGISSDANSGTPTPVRTVALLDLYSGCGGMSTGLCLGAAQAGLKLETKWAVDLNSYACESFKYNHPRTKVRNEKADHYLALLKEWAVLCDIYVHSNDSDATSPIEDEDEEEEPLGKDEFVVENLLEICYGGSGRKDGIYFKVQWKGYGPEEDTWEPIGNLSDCPMKIKEFVQEGHNLNILPLPGDVDVICGGPPCQGISGFNRHRHFDEPLKDEKNRQMITYMDIVSYLRPKFVLMENVGDLLKFDDGYLGRYALSRLVALNYQARMGMMVAGSYGLPQYRIRVFLWGALPSMVLPKFPLPTHEVVVRGGAPNAFSESIVAHDETKKPALKKALVIGDAISDLPKIENSKALVKEKNTQKKKKENYQTGEIVEYGGKPETDFQWNIRLSHQDLFDTSYDDETCAEEGKLLDHQPLRLNQDDYDRVLMIPYRKGANFRDLEGVMVGPDNTVHLDPNVKRVLCKSGKPLVPDYAMSFMKGRSLKPFGRLSMDETVPTVVTRAEPHNQIILHPDQPRVLSVRENARLQGFPDYYRMNGPIKEKYIQVGNAVAVPVARALGFSLARALQGQVDGSHPSLFVLPPSFPNVKQTKESVRASTVPAAEFVEH